jgi:hypothetical protein
MRVHFQAKIAIRTGRGTAPVGYYPIVPGPCCRKLWNLILTGAFAALSAAFRMGRPQKSSRKTGPAFSNMQSREQTATDTDHVKLRCISRDLRHALSP